MYHQVPSTTMCTCTTKYQEPPCTWKMRRRVYSVPRRLEDKSLHISQIYYSQIHILKSISCIHILIFAALVCPVHPPCAFGGGWLCLQGAAAQWQGPIFKGSFYPCYLGGFLLSTNIFQDHAKSHEAESAKKGLKRSPDGHSHSAPSVSHFCNIFLEFFKKTGFEKNSANNFKEQDYAIFIELIPKPGIWQHFLINLIWKPGIWRSCSSCVHDCVRGRVHNGERAKILK